MLEGKVGDFSLPEIFQLIALTKKTGTLRVSTPAQVGHVRFRDGEVCEAASDVRRLALGARLVATGLVDESQLAAALEAKRDRGGEVLRLLLEHAAIDEGALHAFVREQIADAVADMLRFGDAAFRFHSDEVPGDPIIDLTVATDQLVTESNQRLAEWDAIRAQVPSADTVFAVVPTPAVDEGEVTVDADAWQVLALVDGRRPVHEIVDLSGRSEFTTTKLLARLAARKLVEPCGEAEGGPLSSLLARREVLRRLEELELSELPAGPPQPAPVTEHTDPEPAIEDAPRSGGQDSTGQPDTSGESVPPAPAVPGEADEAPEVPGDTGSVPEVPGDTGSVPEVPADVVPVPAAPGRGQAAPPDPVDDDGEDGAPAPATGIDRAQVARELAALGLDEPVATPVHNGSAPAEQADGATEGAEPAPGRRLVRDEDINRGLLLRLIDGVKGA